MLSLPIRTKRLLLRRFSADDLQTFHAYRSDVDLSKYQDWEPLSEDRARAFLAVQSTQELGRLDEWLQVAVARGDTGELIGDLGLCVVDEGAGAVELGYTIVRAVQRQGYAREAVAGVLTALLERGPVRSVVAIADARNGASIALLERLGFVRESTTTEVFRGEPCEEHRFVLTPELWASKKSSPT